VKPELAKYVQVDLSPPRIARLWDSVAPRLAATSSPQRSWLMRGALVGSLLVAAGGGAALYSLREPAASVWQNAVLRTGGDAMSVNLGEGSTLEVASESRVEVAESAKDSVRLNLAQGSVLCDVTHREGRRFVVAAAGVEVRVVGTRFRVALAPSGERVEVQVERGTVEVTQRSDPGHVRRLSAGERWSVAQNAPAASAEPSVAAPSPSEEATSPAPAESAALPEPSADVRPPPRTDKDSPLHEATSTLEVASAKQLLDLANSARRSGDIPLAARAYEALLSRFPRDGRSGLAAFELGRLRLDRLGNPRGAAQAFERAIQLAPGSGFREDAMARLVDAYAALGATDACRRARQSYLESYPAGLHVTGVSSKCSGR
jgi:transmembrane sensor